MSDRTTKAKTDILDEPLNVNIIADVGASYTTRLATDGVYTYIGKATSGAGTASAVWQIQRIDESSGLTILFADGDTLFNNIWDNRVSLSYS